MEKKRKRNINSEVPPELIQLIFSKLPFVNLPSCRLVCKAWNILILTCKFDLSVSISNHFFVHIYRYHNLHCVDFDPKHLKGMKTVASFSFHPNLSSTTYVTIINSCNGLLCCYFEHGQTKTPPCEVCIINPMTNECFKLPISNVELSIGYYGFGFSPKTKQYKLARLSSARDKQATLVETLVEIFAFGISHKWTPVGFVPLFMGMRSQGVYFNGGLYWVGRHEKTSTNVIYRLDIEEEELQEISFPQHGGYSCFIGVFNGTLYLTLCILDFEYYVWKMEEDFSWTKVFNIVIPKEHLHNRIFYLQLIRACEDGNILCLAGVYLILYNPRTGRVELLTDQDIEIVVHLIDSVNFDSLPRILAGNA